MGKPSVAQAQAQRLYRNTLKEKSFEKRITALHRASKLARDAGDWASLMQISKAALLFGIDQLVRLLAGPGAEQRGVSLSEIMMLADSAKHFFRLAVDLALCGAVKFSTICAAFYAEIVGLVGPAGTQDAALWLAKLAGALRRSNLWSEPSADLPPADSGALDSDLGPSPLELSAAVRNPRAADQSAAAENGNACGMGREVAWLLL